MKNSNDTIWNRTGDLPICSTAPYLLCYRGPQSNQCENINRVPGRRGDYFFFYSGDLWIFGMRFFYITLRAPKILRLLLGLLKICALPIQRHYSKIGNS